MNPTEAADGRFPSHIAAVASNLAVDAVTVEVTRALRDAGIRYVVLKGPSTARWLYSISEQPAYMDTDLLVDVHDLSNCEALLRRLGFKRTAAPLPGERRHADPWVRSSDGARVDLHTSLIGARAALSALWQELWRHRTTMSVAGTQVNVLDDPAKALIVALHAAQHGERLEKPHRDLESAIAKVPFETWRGSAQLAERIDALAGLAVGLRSDPQGAALVRRLELPNVSTVELELRRNPPLAGSLALERLHSLRGPRHKALFLIRKLFPPADYVRISHPWARRGRAGLVAVYLWRPLWGLWSAPSAFLAWSAARRRVHDEVQDAKRGDISEARHRSGD